LKGSISTFFISEVLSVRKVYLKWVGAIGISVSLYGCATTDYATGSTEGFLISVEYGEVMGVKQVPMKANYAAGSAVGGGLGLLGARHHSLGTQVAATAAGALIGALVQNAVQGSKTATEYTVALENGRHVAIITEHHDIEAGDCVSVEQGSHANIRRVSPVMCEKGRRDHPAYQEMHVANVSEAKECHQVKQELLDAKTEQEADVAYQKMRAFCEQ
jgi:outer membrane lipoprotein SlyB